MSVKPAFGKDTLLSVDGIVKHSQRGTRPLESSSKSFPCNDWWTCLTMEDRKVIFGGPAAKPSAPSPCLHLDIL